MIVKNVMSTNFHYLHPKQTIEEAIKEFKKASKSEGTNIFGMMVTDSDDQLVGMLSMYDILLFIQPKNIPIIGEMEDLSPEPLFKGILERVKKIYVEDIMATDLETVKPDTHLIMVVDIMLKKHIRRLPVVDKNKVVGIIYRYNVFHHLMKRFTE